MAEIHAVDVSVATSIVENLTTTAITNEEVCDFIPQITVEDNITGFHTEGWGPWNPPPQPEFPPEILKLSMVIVVASMCCLESLSHPVSPPPFHLKILYETLHHFTFYCFVIRTQPIHTPTMNR